MRPPNPSTTPKQRLQLPAGARVVVRDETWVVRHVKTASTGETTVHVTGLSDLVRGQSAIFLSGLDHIEELAPEHTKLVPDPSARHRRSRLYVESLLRRTPATDARLYVGHEGAMNHAPYQWEPAAKALAQPRPRLLIADGVGLGKTLEVGVLLSELMQRGRADRILVVALKSILSQFQQELWARFTIPLVRLDSVGMQRVQSRVPSGHNPFYHFDRCIISIDTLKKDARYRHHLEQARWDVIVIDECHNVAARGSKLSDRARLAQLLSSTTDALILTSATPHDGKPESFASLIELLEPTAIADPQDYTSAECEPYFVRRFKKDIAAPDQFREREIQLEKVAATPAEDAAFEALHGVTFRTIPRSGGLLFRTTLLKALLSSPSACLSTLKERRKKPRLQNGDDDARVDAKVLDDLIRVVGAIGDNDVAKYERLQNLLRDWGWGHGQVGERVVLFSERIDTLHNLAALLPKTLGVPADNIGVFHGSLDDMAQQALVQDFGTENGTIKLLLASDAAAEGINLHYFCHRLIHVDIPWSLITLEQRNGRIDRFGQQHTPTMHYLLTEPSSDTFAGDIRVLERVIEKEHEAHKNLGDVAWLMNLHEADAEATRIGQGIESGESPEAILPDLDPNDPLWLILGGGVGAGSARTRQGLAPPLKGESMARPRAQRGAPHRNTPENPTKEIASDFRGVQGREPLLGVGKAHKANPSPPTLTAPRLSLFPDDLTWARTAFEELAAGAPDDAPRPEWLAHADGFRLPPTQDLTRRYALLPPEVQPQAGGHALTTNRERVMRAHTDARRDDGSWPEWQLFWPLHPVAEWLNDRVLSTYARHEAPLIRVSEAHGIAPGHAAYLIQGMISNQRSQPLIMQWFALSAPLQVKSATPHTFTPLPFESLTAATALGRDVPNIGPPSASTVAALESLIPAAVARARDELLALREERAESMRDELVRHSRELKQWQEKSRARVQRVQDSARAKGRALTKPQERALQQELAHIDKLKKDHTHWVTETLTTVANPYLRIAAVLVNTNDGERP